jgi:hypothetical protein
MPDDAALTLRRTTTALEEADHRLRAADDYEVDAAAARYVEALREHREALRVSSGGDL